METTGQSPVPLLKSLTETRLDLDVIDPASSVVLIHLPSTSTFSRQSRAVVKTLAASSPSKDEADFQRRNAATASSVFFRAVSEDEDEETYPRTIAWRVLESGAALELFAVDLTQPDTQPGTIAQTLRYNFPSSLRTGGVAIADLPGEDGICVFAMTKNNDLYTINVNASMFARPSPSAEHIQNSFRVFRPGALSISAFYKLFAQSATVLLVSLGDGRLLRLTRKDGDDGSRWDETTCDDGQWVASFRGLLPWHAKPTVPFEGNNLNVKTVHRALASPDGKHVFTTGLDHTFKSWSMSTGKPTFVRDLLDLPVPEEGAPKRMIDPATATTLRLFESRSGGGYAYYVMTYSTQSSGLFKIWAISDPDEGDEGIRDSFEEEELRLPEPGDGALWTMSDFEVKGSPNSPEIDVWILMRLNRRSKLFHRRFHDLRNLGDDWNSEWVATAPDARRHEMGGPLAHSGSEQLDVSSRWLELIFSPIGCPSKVIETALSVYTQTKNQKIRSQKGSLPERVAATLSLQIYAQLTDLRGNTPPNPQETSQKEWTNLWNIIQDVDSLRWEPLSLTVDETDGVPWIAFTDGFSVVRDFNELEMLAYNEPDQLNQSATSRALRSVEDESMDSIEPSDQATLVAAAAAFRQSFSDQLQQMSIEALSEQMWTAPLQSPSDRLQSLYDRCNFAEEVSTQQYDDLQASLDSIGGFEGLTFQIFAAVAEQPASPSRKDPQSAFTKIGRGALVRGVQDVVALQLRVLQDLLHLVVFVTGEIDSSTELSADFDPDRIFLTLLEQLRRAQLAHWLAMNKRVAVSLGDEEQQSRNGQQTTVLEDLFARDIKPQPAGSQLERSGLTHAIQDLLVWVAGGNEIKLDDALITIQCDLLKNGNLDLARSFQGFQPPSAWSTYITGRFSLLRQEFSEAALYFKRAAFKLSRQHPPSTAYALSSSGLLDQAEAAFLASGLTNYYSHILSLFEAAGSHSNAVTFARLALQHCEDTTAEQEFRTDLLIRLFRAASALADFDTAASAITRVTDRDVQRKALRELIARIADCGAVHELLHLPLPSMQQDVDALLVEYARAESEQGGSGAGTAVGGAKGSVGLGNGSGSGRPPRIPFFRILYAWRMRVGDTRGAAAVLIERLEAARTRKGGANRNRNGVAATTTTTTTTAAGGLEHMLDEYLVGINALALVGDYKAGATPAGTGTGMGVTTATSTKTRTGNSAANTAAGTAAANDDEEGWVFVEGRGNVPRRVVRLRDLRASYADAMDRLGLLEMGRFGILDDDEDEDGDEEGEGGKSVVEKDGSREVDAMQS